MSGVRAAFVAAVLALAAPLPAAHAADPQDVVAATAQNASDQQLAQRQYTNYLQVQAGETGGNPSTPNVSCTKPTVYGTELLKHNDAIVAETHQTDVAVATAQCVDLTGATFNATITVRIEYCSLRTSITTCVMSSTGFTKSVTTAAKNGVASPTVDLQAIYSDTHAALGKIRRVYACVGYGASSCRTYDYSGTYGV